ncbi:hypothetical protein LR48_Vigan08g006300 [Vigna angularis]|nr:hypothetical protein LR48_Vigan08g006300 [Vigna angularis]
MELRNSDYYHGKDEFGKARGPNERNLDSLNKYDLGHSVEYGLAADIDRERFCVPQDRRTRRRSGSLENVEVSDLRHHLSKRKKVNGLKSVVSHDYALEGHGEEQSHRSFSRKDSLQLPLNESSLGNRFRGRIKLPANARAGGRADIDSGNGKSSNIKNEEVTNGSDPTQITKTQNDVLSEIKEYVKNQNNEESKVKVTDAIGGENMPSKFPPN